MTNTNFFFILQRASNCHWGQKRCTFAQRSWKKYPASTRGICRWRGCRILISFNQKKKNWPNCYIRYSSKKFILNYMVLGYWDSKFRESNKRISSSFPWLLSLSFPDFESWIFRHLDFQIQSFLFILLLFFFWNPFFLSDTRIRCITATKSRWMEINQLLLNLAPLEIYNQNENSMKTK